MTKPRQDGARKPSSLEAFLDQTNSEFGAGAVMSLASGGVEIERITTGSIALDRALGGGLPRGRIVEIYGPESCGKTTVALQAAACVQRAGGNVFFVDAEYALDPDWCRGVGVDTDRLYFDQPDFGEQGLEITNKAVRSGAFDLIIVDSVAALVPRAEVEGEMGDSHPGLQARLMSQALRKIVGGFTEGGGAGKQAVLIFINQLREKIGVSFGNPETTTGGKALKFYASVRLDVRRIETLKNGADNAYGNRLRIKVTKNKVSPPFRTAEIDLLFGRGISREGELVDLGVQQGVLRKSGAWYTYGDLQIGQGKPNACAWLIANPAAADQLESQIRETLAAGTVIPAELEVVGSPFS